MYECHVRSRHWWSYPTLTNNITQNTAVQITKQFINFMLYFMVKLYKIDFVCLASPVRLDPTLMVTNNFFPNCKNKYVRCVVYVPGQIWSHCIKTTTLHIFSICYCGVIKINVWCPCLIWHKGREGIKRNDKYVFLNIYFTSRTIQRYLFTGWVLKNDSSYRDSSQESPAVNSQQTIHGAVVRSKSLVVRRDGYKQKRSCIWRF